MTRKYAKTRSNHHDIIYTLITAILICTVFLCTVGYLYTQTRDDEYENLHVQTKQVKDDIILQLTSDRENLTTMANFAAKLYSDGDDYSLLFDSFKSIGMIENIGILNPDNTLATKTGTVSVQGTLSFEEEKAKGVYISGRIDDVTKDDYKLIRSAVPIVVKGETVGILYGAIKPEKLGARYKQIVSELNAQLFIYEQGSGDMLVDTIQDELGNISFLKDRTYKNGTSYQEFISTDKGFVSFESAYKDENLHLHYSTIDEFGWMIAMGRYDSQVFSGTHAMAQFLTLTFIVIIAIIAAYIVIIMTNEKKLNSVSECASEVRRELLETVGGQDNIQDALTEMCRFAKSRSAVFFDTDGEFYHYISPQYEKSLLSPEEKKLFSAELFRYASNLYSRNQKTVNVMCIKADRHMLKSNPSFYSFLREHKIKEVSLSATISNANHIAILATLNSQHGYMVRRLAEKVSACFSMALYNKNHLNNTILAATTDSLTGVLNRVAYKTDLLGFDSEKALDFSCIYIDVNELHMRNNKFGHAAGDEMLLFIANTLKEVFYGHKIYRMGGDEFLVFCQGLEQETVKNKIELFKQRLIPRDFHVAIGMSYRSQNNGTEDMVREAEVRMYEAKALYYQNKQQNEDKSKQNNQYVQVKTGILEIDTMLSVLKEKYNGIYRVSLTSDKARRILMPAYLNYNENEEHFSKLFAKYVAESVSADYQRAVLNFLNYEALKQQLSNEKTPKIMFKKNDGETVALSVYKLCDTDDLVSDTLWVFSKE